MFLYPLGHLAQRTNIYKFPEESEGFCFAIQKKLLAEFGPPAQRDGQHNAL